MTTWSSNAFFMAREPESITISFRPMPESFCVSSITSSMPAPFTATGHLLSRASLPTASAFAFVAAYRSGFLAAACFRPAARTSAFSLMRMRPAPVAGRFLHELLERGGVAFFGAHRDKVGGELHAHPLVPELGEALEPPATSASLMASVTSTAMPVGLTKVFSWRKSTVSPPVLNGPMVTGSTGGADAESSFAFDASGHVRALGQLGLPGGELHREGEAGRHAAVAAVGLG